MSRYVERVKQRAERRGVINNVPNVSSVNAVNSILIDHNYCEKRQKKCSDCNEDPNLPSTSFQAEVSLS